MFGNEMLSNDEGARDLEGQETELMGVMIK